ncbi:hypothetical protein PENDEC_c021G06128 [Penicillium decumbens]|uniref:Uncharacterized protein n=1 Tax=Penicillium decumbens TaxID=69771 RepID=A0A1V6P6J2_PENDC|nr:hypothetical protein PENDEC_c021G06128 [Penicillium decumbens]
MADKSSPDYKSLYLQAEQRREEAERQQRQAEEQQRQAEEQQRQAEEQQRQAEDRQRQAEDRQQYAEQQTQLTTFTEYIRRCHDLSRSLRVETPSRSTTGQIPSPTGKYCPTRLEYWTDCPKQLSEIYRSVYSYFQPERRQAPRLFSSLLALDGLVRRLVRKPLSSEQELEAYERFAVEEHVHDIITELCKIPAARNEFGLGDGIQFSNHTNTLNENQATEASESQISSIHHPRPDKFCIHRVDGNTNTLLTSVEYKLPHKLSVATLRMGLRPMDLWRDLVRPNKIPTDQEAKLRYNAERLVCSAIVQEYHVMIQEGLEYSFRVQSLVRPMKYRRHLRRRLPQRAAECLHDLRPDVHLRRSDHGRVHRTRLPPTQIKFPATSGASVKLRPRLPFGEQVIDKGLTKKITLDAVLHNSARSDVYSAYRLGTSWTGFVQTWTTIAGAKTIRLSTLSRLKI